MIEVEETDGGLRAVDVAKNEVEIEIEDWVPREVSLGFDRDVELVVSGEAREIRVPLQALTVESIGQDRLRWVQFDENLSVPRDNHLIQADNVLPTFIRVNSEISISSDRATEHMVLSFPVKTLVSVGFRSHVSYPTGRLRVPPTVEGVAHAISSFSKVHKTDTPDRSYPSMRAHPPLLEVSDDVSIDDELGSNPDQNLVIQIPRSLESLFAVAPLSYYLGASIRVSHDVTPVIKFDSLVYQFPGANTFAEEVAAIMTRVFYLDCLVRNAGPYGFEIHELDLLDRLPLDTERLYGLSMSKRLKAYLDVPFDDVAECFPEWPLAVSMDSKVDNIPALPHLLDRLSLIFPPESKPIDERTIVERSLNDFRRSSTNDRCNTDDHRTEKIVPELRYGNVHGWMADGLPVDAFKCPPEAFSNRLDYLDQSHPFSVAVILNDVDMDAEFSKVVTTYQSRADTFSIDVDVMYKLCTDELATLFRSSYDFVHYIGHCDPEGLRCHDGHLSVSDIPEVSVQSFFLNACRSYEEGLDLIRRGSVAGAVTIGDVLDEQARKVGTTFARLMGRGYSIEQSLRLSRARAIMNRQYGVVGDGTHVLTQGISSPPPILSLKKTTGGHYLLSSNCNSPNFHGSIYRLKTAPKPLILGNQTPHAVTERELKAVLRESEEPVIYNDKLYWSDELLEELF